MLRYAVAVAVAVVAASLACADESAAVSAPEAPAGVVGAEPSNWRLGVALGYGGRSNPLIQSDDIPILIDLDVAWFGERLFFDNGDVGVTVSDNEWFTLNVIGRFNSDRVFFGKTDTRVVQLGTGTGAVTVRVSVPEREYAVEGGVEVLTGGSWGRLQLTGFRDLSGTHDGYQFGADYSFGIRQQRWYLEPSIRVTAKSRKLNDYYWGVRPNEAGPLTPPYSADGGTNVALRLLGSYQLTTNWSVSLVAEYERLNSEVAASPIVQDDYVTGFFAGFGYRF